jgi:hypothetical protein
MAEQHTKLTKVLDGLVGLGRNDIIPGTITVDGGPVPATMTVDEAGGTVQWTDQNNLGPPGPYTFQFQWERPLAFQQARAKELVKRKAEDKLDALDETFVGGSLVQDFMTQEVVYYEIEGRPAAPTAGTYSSAATLQTIRGDATLRDTLEWMRTKYIALKTAANAIIGQRFDYLDQIDNAADIPALEAIVTAVEAW